jgi:hypothetical protein
MKQYPDAFQAGPPAPKPEAPAKPAAPKKILTHVILPLAIFVVVVGGITYIAHFLPRWTRKDMEVGKGEPLKFAQKVVIWDMTDLGYVAEFERQTDGYHAFWFTNPGDGAAEVGLESKSCTCASVEVCVLSPEEAQRYQRAEEYHKMLQIQAAAPGGLGQGSLVEMISFAAAGHDGYGGLLAKGLSWRLLERGEKDGALVPAKSAGLVRVAWKGKTRKEEQMRLTAELWTQFQGNRKSRQTVNLETQIGFVSPVLLFPSKPEIEVEDWDSQNVARVEFRCWSSTRAAFTLAARALNPEAPELKRDPCVETECIPLTPKECRELEQEIRARALPPTHVLCGYRVKITVFQEKGGKQLEHGRFLRAIRLTSNAADDLPDVQLTGHVVGDVRIGKPQDKGIVKLGEFSIAEGKTSDPIEISVNPGVKLYTKEQEKAKGALKPLQVRLKEIPKADAGQQNGYHMFVTIPPRAVLYCWPADSAIILYTKQEGQPERRIRIPVEAKPRDS